MQKTVVVLMLTLTASVATAQQHPWLVRLQGGTATIHEWEASGSWAQALVGRSFAGGVLSADLGPAFSGAGQGYFSLTAGLEAVPFPKAVVSPFARAELGMLVEGDLEYGGYVAGLGGGLLVRLNDRLALRGGASWGVHGDVEGPMVYYGGVQVRW
jgi:hypothetical protein